MIALFSFIFAKIKEFISCKPKKTLVTNAIQKVGQPTQPDK